MRRVSILARVSAVLTVATVASICQADLMYDNGAPNGGNGYNISPFIRAADFHLTQPIILTDVRFWGFSPSAQPEGYQGSIVWSIYADDAGHPGTLLQRNSVVPDRSFDHLATLSSSSYRHDFSVGSIYLGPGTYWLGLHNGPLSFAGGTTRFFWEWANANGTLLSYADDVPFDAGAWTSTPQELAFQLSGAVVPVPGAVLLGALGLSLAGWRLKRQTV